MFIYKMIILTTTTSLITMSTNATLLSISTEQIYLSTSYISILKRFFIVFGSICFLWFIMGFIFLSIQTYRHVKRRTKQKFFRFNRTLLPSSHMEQQTNKDDPISDDDDDDQTSVFTSISFLSERSKITSIVPSCEQIPEEQVDLSLPISAGIANMAYSQSTLSSSSTVNDGGISLLYYPACRNFAYSQSTLASSADLNTPTPSVAPPSSSKSSLNRLVNLKRHSSQSSTTTTFSQITNATYLSSSSASTSSSNPTTLVKPLPLPTVMITDCDRLQTDIIELDEFEPEKDWRHARPELRLLLNDRMPQAVR